MGGLHGNEPASTESLLLLIHNLLEVDSLRFNQKIKYCYHSHGKYRWI